MLLNQHLPLTARFFGKTTAFNGRKSISFLEIINNILIQDGMSQSVENKEDIGKIDLNLAAVNFKIL